MVVRGADVRETGAEGGALEPSEAMRGAPQYDPLPSATSATMDGMFPSEPPVGVTQM
jgi:hypothetical protein